MKNSKALFLVLFYVTGCSTFHVGDRFPTNAPPGRIAQMLQLPSDVEVQKDLAVLKATVTVPSTSQPLDILIESDGRYFPGVGKSLANVQIYVDGQGVGSASTIDWRQSTFAVQHSFNSVAVAHLGQGAHQITLVAQNLTPGTSFKIGAQSNLLIFQSSARRVHAEKLLNDSAQIAGANTSSVVINPLLSLGETAGQSALLLSGRVYWNGTRVGAVSSPLNHFGDAMVGISLENAQCPRTSQQSWSVNDLWVDAELQGPVFSHGISKAPGVVHPSATASAFPWINAPTQDQVQFKLGKDTTLIAVEDPHILGAGYNSHFQDKPCDTQAYICIGSTARDYSKTLHTSPGVRPWPDCPVAGTRTTLVDQDVEVPARHDGAVMLLAKTRIQADNADAGGIISLGLSVDGVDRGSVGVQELHKGDAVSQRTLSASYLAAAPSLLSVGHHRVQVWIKADGDFLHVVANKDLTLLYFD